MAEFNPYAESYNYPSADMGDYEQEALRQFMEQYDSSDTGEFDPTYYDSSPNYGTAATETRGFDPTVGQGYAPEDDGKTQANFLTPLLNLLKDPSTKNLQSLLTSNLGRIGLPLLLGYAANRMRQKPTGGGTTVAYGGPRQYQRSISDGIAKYAANGGLMQAYASGGVTGTHQSPLHMEDGGFVMTKKAVDGAGGPRGISQLLPGARPIFGPGTGTSDDIPATIAGTTPARVSNGEAYVPKAVVDQAGGASALYALMDRLQRRA